MSIVYALRNGFRNVAGKTKVGILALQGAVDPHSRALEKVGAKAIAVRKAEHLEGLSGIILPGGESTTMIHLLRLNLLWEPLKQFLELKPVFGVCAGAILLAKKVTHPSQLSLEQMDIDVERNAYGRQSQSFCAELTPTKEWSGMPMEGVFIRAPRIVRVGPAVRTLLEHEGEPVMVEEGKRLAATFHPELTETLAVHHYFVTKCETEGTPWMTASRNTSDSLSIN